VWESLGSVSRPSSDGSCLRIVADDIVGLDRRSLDRRWRRSRGGQLYIFTSVDPCRVSCSPLPEVWLMLMHWIRICRSFFLNCAYRTNVDFTIEEIEALLSSRFIDEEFFKPTVSKFRSSEQHLTTHTGSLPVSRGPIGEGVAVHGHSRSYAASSPPTRSSLGSRPLNVPLPVSSNTRRVPSSVDLTISSSSPSQRTGIASSGAGAQEGAFVVRPGESSRPPLRSHTFRTSSSPSPSSFRTGSPLRPGSFLSSTPPLSASPSAHEASPTMGAFGPSSSLRYQPSSSAGSSMGGIAIPTLHRYSSARYARSLSGSSNIVMTTGESGDTPAAGGTTNFNPGSSGSTTGSSVPGRRSRLSSETVPVTGRELARGVSDTTVTDDKEALRALVGLIDSRPPIRAKTPAHVARSEAESQLRSLASSVAGEAGELPPTTAASGSGSSSGALRDEAPGPSSLGRSPIPRYDSESIRRRSRVMSSSRRTDSLSSMASEASCPSRSGSGNDHDDETVGRLELGGDSPSSEVPPRLSSGDEGGGGGTSPRVRPPWLAGGARPGS
jgi:hypothetical protein